MCLSAALSCGAEESHLTAPLSPGADRTLIIEADTDGAPLADFSFCGYRGGGVKIPHVPARLVVEPIAGDATALIQAAIAELTRKRTSLIIAHRLSTIQNADKILVLHRGMKAEEGTHQELLARRGIYWRLYQLQYKEERIRGKEGPD